MSLPVVIAGAALALASMAAAVPAWAAFPEKPVTLIVPFPAGGTMDTVARQLAQGLSQSWRQPVIVENKPGAGTTIGTRQIAQSAPDGHTIGMVANSFAINASLLDELPYDTRADFAPVALVAYTPHVLVARQDLPVASVRDVLALAKAQPGQLSFASFGTGTSPHLAVEMLKQQAGVDVAHIPYKGQAPALNDLLGGHVDLLFSNLPDVLPHLQSGRLQAVAVADAQRAAQLPDVPTLEESGLPGFYSNSWFAVVAPAGVPADTLRAISSSIVEAVRTPSFTTFLSGHGLQAEPMAAEAFTPYLAAEIDKAATLIQETGARQ
ncbi:tripartite tricarboxylate transporter substrate binding protein [Verticiella sediminum]|uniref:Tripartite tricarboxylate transporter substrate binding protein n=1 Tax=Verticiella sediminum TaxID=1247510 RepID=A0A556AKE7_9BURK|nr:tripartite tricarboxylate transporter substrate binding protein [Verticiella sediminum]TSH93374.1 tripartite tricarboxylate transporter substrate binding protein [Verticiella sediminum]